MKKRWIAISCTTLEALENCIREQCCVIAIEEPLYSHGKEVWKKLDGMKDYRVTRYASLHFAMLVKIHGENIFDRSKYEVYYFPLHGHRS